MSFDPDAAARFLEASRSRFLREAGGWLSAFEDPIDLLFMLSREVGQSLGPWETFRFCALLGLTPASAVRELGEDVLGEPVEERGSEPPIAPAMAIAHAHATWPDVGAAHAARALELLHERRHADGSNLALVAAAQLALSHAGGPARSPRRFTDSLFACRAALSGPDALAVAGPILEAAVLSEDRSGLEEAAWAKVAESQRDDGGVTALSEHALIRGFATLRVLALYRRKSAPRALGQA